LICSAIRGQPHVGLRCFISTTARITSAFGPFGPGLALRFGENSSRYFRCTKARWKCSRVDGLKTIATRRKRIGMIQSAQNPAIRRSKIRRFGARRRERLTISSWCLMRTDSATTARRPPGRASRKTVTITWTSSTTRSRMGNLNKRQNPANSAQFRIRQPQEKLGGQDVLPIPLSSLLVSLILRS
jgi:hypothetical protein